MVKPDGSEIIRPVEPKIIQAQLNVVVPGGIITDSFDVNKEEADLLFAYLREAAQYRNPPQKLLDRIQQLMDKLSDSMHERGEQILEQFFGY
jgi:hypothetical protein